jgi:Mechanosensitive ion channel
MDMATVDTFLRTTVADLAVKVAAAIVFWFVGRWLISRVIHLVQATMHRNQIDPTLTRYLGSIITVALNIALVLGILGYFGIQTTSIAAMLAGAGVAIGAAWSGMLGNFAAGAFMLILRPFKVGDFVSIAGVTGTVHELGLFGTTIVTPDNVLTLIGNGKIFGDTIRAHGTARRWRGSQRRNCTLPGGRRKDPERPRATCARSEPARHQPSRHGDCSAPVLPHRSLLAGLLRYQPGDDARRQGSRLARADAREPHADDPGAGVALPVRRDASSPMRPSHGRDQTS